MHRESFLPVAVLLLLLAPVPSFGHYPFPSLPEEEKAAAGIAAAVQAGNQASVATLTGLLGDESPRVQTAALLGIMQLSNTPLDLGAAVTAIRGLQGAQQPYLVAAAEAGLILLDQQTPEKERLALLLKLTQSDEGFQRRMALEALRQIADASVLPALEALAAERFDDEDGLFDMKAVGRVAFEVWWPIRSAELTQEQRLEVLAGALRLGEPFGSRWCDAACNVLEREGEPAVPPLVAAARGEHKGAKLWALRTLTKVGSKDAVTVVLDVCAKDLGSEDQLLQQSAANFLSRMADERVLEALTTALGTSRDPTVRLYVAIALGRIDSEGAVAALRAGLADPEEAVKTQAAAELAKKGLHDGEPILLEALRCRTEGGECFFAIRAMAYIRDQDRLTERIVGLLQRQPTAEAEPARERERMFLWRVQTYMLQQLAGWDAEKLRPMAPALKRALLQRPGAAAPQVLLDKLGDATSTGKPATAEPSGIGSPAPETRRAAIEARERADRLCSAYREAHRTPVVRSADEQQAFDAVVSAYELVLRSYAGTEAAASCHRHLAALYAYRGHPDEALKLLEEAARCYAGTPYNVRAVSALGLHYLQGLHDPERAIPWLEKVEPPPGADQNGAVPAAAYNEAHKLYLSAQESIAMCEMQLGKPELAEQRSEALARRYPMYRQDIMELWQRGLESALSDPACRDLWPILRQWQAKGKKAE